MTVFLDKMSPFTILLCDNGCELPVLRPSLTDFQNYPGISKLLESEPHWKKKSGLGPHIKYIATHNHTQKHLIMF